MMVIAILLSLLAWSPEAQASGAAELRHYDVSSAMKRQLNSIAELKGSPAERQTEALAIVTAVAEDETVSDVDRSVAYELRAGLRPGTDAEADDLWRAIELTFEDDVRLGSLVPKLASRLLDLRRLEQAKRLAEDYGSFLESRGGSNLYRAEILAASRRPEEALEVIGPANQAEDGLLERRLRYTLLLYLARYDEAEAALRSYTRDS
jgi:hypothetical protein